MLARSLILLCSLLAISHSRDLSQDYRFSQQLNGDDYVLYWKFDYDSKNITFAVRVKTTGWIGFGLSPTGLMPQSDVVIGWVDNSGRAMLQDRYAEARATPPIDPMQNWYLIRGEEVNGTTTLEFWRNFSSCDQRDLEIGKSQTSRIVWSYNPDDPVKPTGQFLKHTHRGNQSLNLLGGLQRERSVPSDSATFVIQNNQVLIPNNTDYTYWCTFQEHNVPPGDIYIYKATPMVTPESARHIQHIIVVVCPTFINKSQLYEGSCEGGLSYECYYGDHMPGWANGGGTYTYPEDVALHVKLEAGQRVYLEVHYDNPNLDSGIIDSSGMLYYYTRQRPVHVAGTLTIEYNTYPYLTLVVPPNAEEFNITSACPSRCNDATFPQDGITIFSTFHHSNILGSATIAHRSRRNDECNAVEELEPIDQNLLFDYKFEDYTILQKPVTVQKDDILSITCTYNSKRTNRQGVTLAGLSRRDEQCYVSFEYYPKAHLTYCGTHSIARLAYGPLLSKYFPEAVVNNTLDNLNFYDPVGVANVFNMIQWTPENITELQRSLANPEAVDGYCWYDYAHPNGNAYIQFSQNKTTIDCPYEAPNQCTGSQPRSCCDRLRGNSAAQQTIVIAASAAGAVAALILVVVVLAVIIAAAIFCTRSRRKEAEKDGERYTELMRKQSVQEAPLDP